MKTKKNIADALAAEAKKDTLIVEVTIKQTYMFPSFYVSQFNKPKELIDAWFKRYPLSSYHASRDASLVGGSQTLTRVRTLMGKK